MTRRRKSNAAHRKIRDNNPGFIVPVLRVLRLSVDLRNAVLLYTSGPTNTYDSHRSLRYLQQRRHNTEFYPPPDYFRSSISVAIFFPNDASSSYWGSKVIDWLTSVSNQELLGALSRSASRPVTRRALVQGQMIARFSLWQVQSIDGGKSSQAVEGRVSLSQGPVSRSWVNLVGHTSGSVGGSQVLHGESVSGPAVRW